MIVLVLEDILNVKVRGSVIIAVVRLFNKLLCRLLKCKLLISCMSNFIYFYIFLVSILNFKFENMLFFFC